MVIECATEITLDFYSVRTCVILRAGERRRRLQPCKVPRSHLKGLMNTAQKSFLSAVVHF